MMEERLTHERADREGADRPTKRVRQLEPLADRVIIRVVKDDEVLASGIVIPDSVRERSQRGIVLAVGPGRWEHGQHVPLSCAVGDVLLFSKYGGTELPEGLASTEEGGQLVLREADILAIETFEEVELTDEEIAERDAQREALEGAARAREAEDGEAEARARYRDGIARGLTDAEAREEGWPENDHVPDEPGSDLADVPPPGGDMYPVSEDPRR